MAGAGMMEKKPIEDKTSREKQSDAKMGEGEPTETLPGWPLVGLSIGSFIQVVAMDQQTCMLEVYRGRGKHGHFCFIQGSLYDAVCGDLVGENAAMEIMSWQNVRLNIKHIIDTTNIVRTVNKGLMSLLMESSRRQDEAAQHAEEDASEEAIDGDHDVQDGAHPGLRTGLEKLLDALRKNMGDALIGTAIVSRKDGEVLLRYESTPSAIQFFKTLTDLIGSVFSHDASEHELGAYYYLDLADDQTLFVLLFDEYIWGIVFDNDAHALGLFLNVLMPRLMQAFAEAVETGGKP
jgi:hypothetical protein